MNLKYACGCQCWLWYQVFAKMGVAHTNKTVVSNGVKVRG